MNKGTFIISLCCGLAVGTVSAHAHGVEKVRRELSDMGYSEIEFQRTKPPFKLDACQDGTRYHLHVDFYGKITEKSVAGACDEAAAAAPETNDDAVDDAEDEVTGDASRSNRPSDEAISRGWRYFGDDYRPPGQGE